MTAATTTATTPTTTEQPQHQKQQPLPLPVDRQWLAKLLQRHHHAMPALVLAPMVDQSDLPFRLLTRRYGCHLCFTPMIHCGLYSRSVEYRAKFSLANLPLHDRPLVAQLCGSHIDQVLYTAVAVAPYCDAVDINCGCPQAIARRGNYGAFLLEQPDQLLLPLIRALVQQVPVPITVKVRLLPAATRDESVQKSLQLYTQLVQAGVHMLTIHGRTRDHKGPLTGPADWPAIRQIVQALGHKIPILANGSVASRPDVMDCLRETQADGVMCSEAILEYPALFATVGDIRNHHNLLSEPEPEPPRTIGRVALAREYLQLARQYPPHIGGQGSSFKCIRTHVHRMLHADLQDCTTLRQRIIDVETWHELWNAVEWLAQQQAACKHDIQTEQLSWYMRHRTIVRDSVSGRSINVGQVRKMNETAIKSAELEEDTAECLGCLFENDDQGEY